jgi:bis(5'-nucleosyl)-tetraphosphatase (symmetrical)
MATYAIGDVQGCFGILEKLLRRIEFAPGQDRLWFAGDLVNRGPDSLGVVRFVRSLGEHAVTVLGNHDLRLLAIFHRVREGRPQDTLETLIAAHDAPELMTWLAQRPLVHREGPHTMLHAGLVPSWTSDDARTYAQEVEAVLCDPAAMKPFLAAMSLPPERAGARVLKDADRWDDALTGMPRLTFISKVLTYLRVCDTDGRVFLDFTGEPAQAPAPFMPWFKVPGRKSCDTTVVCGHWSALGLHLRDNIRALDTGAVWGRGLTAYRLDDGSIFTEPA